MKCCFFLETVDIDIVNCYIFKKNGDIRKYMTTPKQQNNNVCTHWECSYPMKYITTCPSCVHVWGSGTQLFILFKALPFSVHACNARASFCVHVINTAMFDCRKRFLPTILIHILKVNAPSPKLGFSMRFCKVMPTVTSVGLSSDPGRASFW